MITYTHSERTQKTRTVGQALQNASILYKGPLCTNAISGRDLGEAITLVELNELVERIVDDSKFYAC